MAAPENRPFQLLLVTVGVISLGLGGTGIFLPLLPTTPFLLVSAYCFSRSSERLHRWLLSHKWLGPYIKNYQEHRALPAGTKVVVLILLWATIGYAVLRVVSWWMMDVALVGIAAAVTVHIMRMKTLTRDMLFGSSEKDRGHEA
ncbi:MAG: DUF454 family protein [Chitinivibrionales bacterium]|nr:DUF454 family protein [Chitinivibrionales bacterium]MBD3395867.1 DUF454 family protein [Chitinivibrionales bacterium]